MTNEELIRLQDTQYEILKAVADVCKAHGITYYLAYGTLLGAIRHGKSIPWDCDIDIFMDGENFEKFCSVASELPEIYEFKKVGGKWGGLSRVYKKGTLLYEPDHGEEEAFPIHIDVFKLEYAKPYHGVMWKCACGLVKYLMVAKLSKYEKRWIYEHFKDQPLKRWICRSGDFLKLFASEETMEKWAHDLIISAKAEENYTSLQDVGKKYPAVDFGDGKQVRYEDELFTAPAHPEDLLGRMYGDYMAFPPEEERFTSHMDSLKVRF